MLTTVLPCRTHHSQGSTNSLQHVFSNQESFIANVTRLRKVNHWRHFVETGISSWLGKYPALPLAVCVGGAERIDVCICAVALHNYAHMPHGIDVSMRFMTRTRGSMCSDQRFLPQPPTPAHTQNIKGFKVHSCHHGDIRIGLQV